MNVIDDIIKCSKCNINKSISEYYFRSSGKPFKTCKSCKLDYQKQYSIDNSKNIETYRKKYYQENKEKIILDQLERDKKRATEIATYNKIYRKNNINKYKIYRQNKKKKINNKLRGLVSNAIYQALKINSNSKNNLSFLKFVNYTIQELKNHLENQFEFWMTWKNWGIYDANTWDDNDPSTWTWQIDHVIPQSGLIYSSMEDDNFKKCWALENLRPLSSKQNILDGASKIRHKYD